MKFNIPLPTDPLYCPKLTCAVYDYIFKGWNQPMIGVFTLPIGQLMMDLRDERREETEVMEYINSELQKIIEDGDYQVKDYSVDRSKKKPLGILNDSNTLATEEYDSDSNLMNNKELHKAKKRTASRKKKIQKSVRGSELGKEGADEVLGPNDEEGQYNAQQKKAEQLKLMHDAKLSLMSGGLGEDDAVNLKMKRESSRSERNSILKKDKSEFM